MPGQPADDIVAARSPGVVMRLARLGSLHQSRLSFLRVLLRRATHENWTFDRILFDFDAKGVGTAVYAVRCGGGRTLSLVAFGHDLPADQRTDRVIAEALDATFALYDGEPSQADIERLMKNVPRQEAGRYRGCELVLARANRSLRLFEHVVDALAKGHQPDASLLESTGYLMRTTAVYGNGKFGIADRDAYKDRAELTLPFQAEMLTVYLIRSFTADLVEHMARLRAPETAAPMAPELRRRLGIGNSTGLGMAPFLLRHPALVDRWITARETALARVRSIAAASTHTRNRFRTTLAAARKGLTRWSTDDAVQAPRIETLTEDLRRLDEFAVDAVFAGPRPWDGLYTWAEENLSLEGQEYAVSLILEPHGDLIDELAAGMAAEEEDVFRIDGRRTCGELLDMVDRHYGWALEVNFAAAGQQAKFWYVSEEKLEPRIGDRALDDGADLEQPLAVARDVQALRRALASEPRGDIVGTFLMRRPEHRHTVRRIQRISAHPYAEIQDNLIAADLRPVDILRAKLAFFGATRFDPKSDKWLRITLFQGAPYPHELQAADWDGWIWGDA